MQISELMLKHLDWQGLTGRSGCCSACSVGLWRRASRVGSEDKQPVSRPIRHAWRAKSLTVVSGAAGGWRSRFEKITPSASGWLQAACIATTLRQLSRDSDRQRPGDEPLHSNAKWRTSHRASRDLRSSASQSTHRSRRADAQEAERPSGDIALDLGEPHAYERQP